MEDSLNFAVARTHLLKMITPELQAIQTLQRHQPVSIVGQRSSASSPTPAPSPTTPHAGRGALSVEVRAGLSEGYVRDVDGWVKAAGLGRRRSRILSEDTAFELPLLLTRVPLVFLCCRHGGGDLGRFRPTRREETRLGRFESLMRKAIGLVSGTKPTAGERTTGSSGGAAGS